MSTPTANGTYGARQPGGRFMKLINGFMKKRIKRTGKMPGMGFDALVLTTVGRKSGIERENPLGYFPGPDGSWIVAASANGAPKNPDWYYNLLAHPDKAQIEFAGRKVAVTAEHLEGAERDEAWKKITTASAQFAKYEKATDRVIPVIRLRPRAH